VGGHLVPHLLHRTLQAPDPTAVAGVVVDGAGEGLGRRQGGCVVVVVVVVVVGGGT
jgi:hypothetical protein